MRLLMISAGARRTAAVTAVTRSSNVRHAAQRATWPLTSVRSNCESSLSSATEIHCRVRSHSIARTSCIITSDEHGRAEVSSGLEQVYRSIGKNAENDEPDADGEEDRSRRHCVPLLASCGAPRSSQRQPGAEQGGDRLLLVRELGPQRPSVAGEEAEHDQEG